MQKPPARPDLLRLREPRARTARILSGGLSLLTKGREGRNFMKKAKTGGTGSASDAVVMGQRRGDAFLVFVRRMRGASPPKRRAEDGWWYFVPGQI